MMVVNERGGVCVWGDDEGGGCVCVSERGCCCERMRAIDGWHEVRER